MMNIFKRGVTVILFLLLTLALPVNMIYAEDGSSESQMVRIYGRVVDFTNSTPLCDVKICVIRRDVWAYQSFSMEDLDLAFGENYEQNLLVIATTNGSGFFDAHVDRSSVLYRYTQEMVFLARFDNSLTPGIDYVPSFNVIHNDGSSEFRCDFSLLPGATINLIDNPFFNPSELFFLYELLDENGELSTVRAAMRFLVLEGVSQRNRFVCVPANTELKIRIKILGSAGMSISNEQDIEMFSDGRRTQAFIRIVEFTFPSNGSSISLKQGQLSTLNLKEQRLFFEAYNALPLILSDVKILSDKIGFLSTYEKTRIAEADALLTKGRISLTGRDYVDSQADLYEAYLILDDVKKSLLETFENSVISIYLLTPFISVSSSSIGALLFRQKKKRLIANVILYVSLVFVLYFTFPGYSLAQESAYNPLFGTAFESLLVPLFLALSFLLGYVIINARYTKGEKSDRRTLSLRSAIVASFSLAAENLKRRKTRTFLVMSMVTISVLAFIDLTSFSFESGFTVERARGTAPSEGILVLQRPTNNNSPYGPLDPEIVEWLEEYEGVQIVAPLLKSLPQISLSPMPIGTLSLPESSNSEHYNILGILGVRPSLEANITGLHQIISGAGMGSFLSDTDVSGILISAEASTKLGLGPNETVIFCGRNFTVVGIFSSAKLGQIVDLDGKSILPQNVRVIPAQGGASYSPEYVRPEEVVIVLDETASNLPLNIANTRAVVRTLTEEQMLPLARAVSLLFARVESYVSLKGDLKHLYIGERLVAFGFAESLILLVLTSLNVGVMLLNSVYERRREIMTLSTIGLNPTQISAVLLCEALTMSFIAGNIGYFIGLVNYHFLFSTELAPIVKFKAEVSWSMVALFFAIASSMIGSLIPSLKASVKMTPSLLRRFVLPSKKTEKNDTWDLEIPLKIVDENQLKSFFLFMQGRMMEFSEPSQMEERAEKITLSGNISNPESLRLHFNYKCGSYYVFTENEIFATKDNASGYTIKLSSKTPLSHYWIKENVWHTSSFVRRLALEYSEKEKINQ
ncbi:MAG: ABC transporter permease [Candidatus Bathyarchaeia archaeon]